MTLLAHQIERTADRVRVGSSFVSALQSQREDLRAMMTLELSVEFEALGDRVAEAVDGYGGLLVEAATDREAGRIEAILTRARLREWSSARLSPVFQRAWQRALRSTIDTFKSRTAIERETMALERHVLRIGGLRAGLIDIVGDTRRALFKTLDLARSRDLAPEQAANLIRDFVPDGRFVNAGRAYRSELIARSEMRSAQNIACVEIARPLPLLASDGTGDELCASRDGGIFSADEAIQEDANTHPNCVLTFSPVYV